MLTSKIAPHKKFRWSANPPFHTPYKLNTKRIYTSTTVGIELIYRRATAPVRARLAPIVPKETTVALLYDIDDVVAIKK